ncbi:MAG: serine/threonine protein phosphatase [Clostridia bacterium]|nr:serine/threonine protein phosphatase [Clostridia bacterium]
MNEGRLLVMSDLHGCYDKYQMMLEKIKFNDKEDKLIILGDVLDRGENPLCIIKDIMKRENVELLMGNHELFAFSVMPYVNSPIDEINEEFYSEELRKKYFTWMWNGGDTTFDEFYKLSIKEQKEIIAYLQELPSSIEVTVNGNKYFLSHAGINNYISDEELGWKTVEDFVWRSPDNFDMPFFKEENRFLVFGHTPTFRIPGGTAGKIFKKNNYIGIDCGAVFEKYFEGKLGCLCLNTMEEFYV